MFHLSDIEHRFFYCFKKILQNKHSDVRIIAVLVLQEILIKPFLMSQNLKTQGCPNGTEPNALNRFSQEKKIVKQGLGHLFITLVVVLISSIKPI